MMHPYRTGPTITVDGGWDDVIEEPGNQPAENSYYGVKEIEAKANRAGNMEFKQCFEIDKEIIPTRGKILLLQAMNRAPPPVAQEHMLKSPSEDYLVSKLHTRHNS